MGAGRVVEHRRRQGEDGADRLREALRRTGRVAVADGQARRHDPRREQPERAQRRPGDDASDEAVGEQRDRPALLECDREHGQHGDRAGDEASRGLVDRVREGEEPTHHFKNNSVSREAPCVVSLARVAPARHRPLPRLPRGRASRSSRCRCARRAPASARTCSGRRRASSRASSAFPGAAAPARRCAAGSSWTRTTFYATFYCASVTRCYPGRAPSGRGDRTPSLREQELCEFWRDWELALLRPRLIVTVGGLALRRLLGLGQLTGAIGERYERDGATVLPLPHPSGASGWLNVPANRERLAAATGLVRDEIARLTAGRRRPSRPEPDA